MNSMTRAATVGLCLLCLSLWFSGECSAKTFRLAVTGSNDVLCATDEANQTISISDLPSYAPGNLPPEVRCARHCTFDAPCHSFNYRSDIDACEFHHYPPTVCQPVSHCRYFQVTNLIISIIKHVVPGTANLAPRPLSIFTRRRQQFSRG